MDIRLNPFLINPFETTKELTIKCNDPKNRSLVLPVTTIVEPEFSIEPLAVDFGTVEKGDAPVVQVRFTQIADQTFAITGVNSPEGQPNDFDASFQAVPEAEWKTPGKPEFVVAVALSELTGEGPFSRFLDVHTTIKRVATFHLPLTATVHSFYTVEPPGHPVSCRAFSSATKSIPLKVRSDVPITVSDLTTDAPDLIFREADDGDPNTISFEIDSENRLHTGARLVNVSFIVHSADGRTGRETRTLDLRVMDLSDMPTG
jgi:hypothetical protein